MGVWFGTGTHVPIRTRRDGELPTYKQPLPGRALLGGAGGQISAGEMTKLAGKVPLGKFRLWNRKMGTVAAFLEGTAGLSVGPSSQISTLVCETPMSSYFGMMA